MCWRAGLQPKWASWPGGQTRNSLKVKPSTQSWEIRSSASNVSLYRPTLVGHIPCYCRCGVSLLLVFPGSLMGGKCRSYLHEVFFAVIISFHQSLSLLICYRDYPSFRQADETVRGVPTSHSCHA